MSIGLGFGLLLAIAAALAYLLSSVKVIREYERGVMFFFGRYVGLRGPGLRFVFRPMFKLRIIDMRTIVEDVAAQDVITRDNVSAKVNAVLYFRVIHADKAVLQVEDYRYATSQLAQTGLRSLVGANELDALLSERERLNAELQTLLDTATDPWGIKVSSVEFKHVEVPGEMRRVMARQAEAERERRAKIIASEGEFQAARKLADAAAVLAEQPGTLQLRYLQTLVEVSSGKNTVTLFPIPLEVLRAFDRFATMTEERAPERKTGAQPGRIEASGNGGSRGRS
jgi:regulator of protease activity HflC (stomatin/prohibitin superfamily)